MQTLLPYPQIDALPADLHLPPPPAGMTLHRLTVREEEVVRALAGVVTWRTDRWRRAGATLTYVGAEVAPATLGTERVPLGDGSAALAGVADELAGRPPRYTSRWTALAVERLRELGHTSVV